MCSFACCSLHKSANSKPPMRPDVYNLSNGATLGCANFDSHPSSHHTSIITECLRLGWKKGLWKLAQPAHPGFTPIVLTYFHVQMWLELLERPQAFFCLDVLESHVPYDTWVRNHALESRDAEEFDLLAHLLHFKSYSLCHVTFSHRKRRFPWALDSQTAPVWVNSFGVHLWN